MLATLLAFSTVLSEPPDAGKAEADRSIKTQGHWYTSPLFGGPTPPANYFPFNNAAGPGVWAGMLNHNPRFQRGNVNMCNNNDVVIREDLDSSGCIYLQGWAVGVEDHEIDTYGVGTQTLQFKVEVSNAQGSYPGMFATEPCIDINPSQGGTCCNPACGGNCNTGDMHFQIGEHQFGQADIRVTLVDNGPCDNGGDLNNVCLPEACCESDPLEFQVTVLPVNDCPRFHFSGVDVDEQDNPITRRDYPNGVNQGVGGYITSYEDTHFCQPVIRRVAYGGVNEGPGELAPSQDIPWHDQVLVWSITNSDNAAFDTAPHIRYVEGSDVAELCYMPAKDMVGEVNISIHLEDTGGTTADTIGMPVPCTTSNAAAGCFERFPDENILIIILEVNDPPTFKPGEAEIRALEDSGRYSRRWATDIKVGPDDELANGQLLSHFEVELVNPEHRALFLEQPSMDLDGTLTFETRRNVHTVGIEVIAEVRLMDFPKPPLLPAYSQKPDPTVRFIILPVNDAPYYTPNPPPDVEIWEDQVNYTEAWANPELFCAGWDDLSNRCIANEGDGVWTVGSDTYPGEGQVISFTTIPRDPTLFDGNPYINETGFLFIDTAKDQNGETEVLVSGVDDGGVTPGIDKGPELRFFIRIRPVNDPPLFDIEKTSLFVEEDSGEFVFQRFLHNISPGPIDERDQELTIHTSVINQKLFTAEGQPKLILDATGTTAELRFTVAPDMNGVASLHFYIQDNGGTDGNGDDRSDGPEVLINILDVNDIPDIVKGMHININEDTYLNGYQQSNWISSSSPGNMEQVTQYVSYTTTCVPSTMFVNTTEGLPHISPHGTLYFTPVGDQYGASLCDVVVQDRSLQTDEVIDTLPPFQFMIGIAPVNDRPSFIVGRDISVGECNAFHSINCFHKFTYWCSNQTAGPANEIHQQLSFNVTSETRNISSVFKRWPQIDGLSCSLEFELNPGEILEPPVELTVTLQDDGGVLRSGVDSFSRTFLLDVVPGEVLPPFGDAIPTRLIVSQQPATTGGNIIPATFQLLDHEGSLAYVDATWTFHLYQLDPTANVIGSPKDVLQLQLTKEASASYGNLLAGGPGKYLVEVNVTSYVNGMMISDLTAFTHQFDVVSQAGDITTTLFSTSVDGTVLKEDNAKLPENKIRNGQLHLELSIGEGTQIWQPNALEATLTSEFGTEVQINPVISNNNKLLTININGIDDDFNIHSDTSFVLKIPSGDSEQIYSFVASAAPEVLVQVATSRSVEAQEQASIISVTGEQFEESGLQVTYEIYGDTWDPLSGADAVLHLMQPSSSGKLSQEWGYILSSQMTSPSMITVLLSSGVALSDEETISLLKGVSSNETKITLLDDLRLATTSKQVPELKQFGNAISVNIAAKIPADPMGAPSSAKMWSLIGQILAWIVTIFAAFSVVLCGWFGNAVGICVIPLLASAFGPQPQIQTRYDTRLLWSPFYFINITGNNSSNSCIMLFIVAICVALLHTVVQVAVRQRITKDTDNTEDTTIKTYLSAKAQSMVLFPSATMSVMVLAVPLCTYNAFQVLIHDAEGPYYDPNDIFNTYKKLYDDNSATTPEKVGSGIVWAILILMVVASLVYVLKKIALIAYYSKFPRKQIEQDGQQVEKKMSVTAPRGEWHSPPDVHGVLRFGSAFQLYKGGTTVFMAVVDVGTIVLLPVFASLSDSVGGNSTLGRISMLLCVLLLSARCVFLSLLAPYIIPLLGYLDLAGCVFAAAGCVFLLLFSVLNESLSDTVVNPTARRLLSSLPVDTTHWCSDLAFVLFLMSLLCFAILLGIIIFKGGKKLYGRWKNYKKNKKSVKGEPSSSHGSEYSGHELAPRGASANPIVSEFPSYQQPVGVRSYDDALVSESQTGGSIIHTVDSKESSARDHL
eukprot:TRINITY_DN1033_c1_g2_i1.p1 TRINITY_DN1033_c1_g2~~TRINITY_DN1033_c1_g2_i1.p1  ORF type:complete len:1887 (+),score=396.81 TRINITY_DN1033_c1_g2_i1:55-5715(+)